MQKFIFVKKYEESQIFVYVFVYIFELMCSNTLMRLI